MVLHWYKSSSFATKERLYSGFTGVSLVNDTADKFYDELLNKLYDADM